MTTARKTGIILTTAILSGYLGLASSIADDLTPDDQQPAATEVRPGSASPWWGFPPVGAGSSSIARSPMTAEQQFAAFRDGSWPGTEESRWAYAHGSEQGSANSPSAAEQWAAAESGNWPGKAESRWGRAHFPGDDASSFDRRAAVDSK